MSEIPENVLQDARDAYVKARELARGGPCHAGEMIWHPIARAILAERDRCAAVARAWPLCKLTQAGAIDPKMVFDVGAGAQAMAIAHGILSGEQP